MYLWEPERFRIFGAEHAPPEGRGQEGRLARLMHSCSSVGTDMRLMPALAAALLLATAAGLGSRLDATVPDPADQTIRKFLAQDDTQRPYRATRRLEASIREAVHRRLHRRGIVVGSTSDNGTYVTSEPYDIGHLFHTWFNAIGINAIITCPLVKENVLRAMMAVHQTTPRDWKPGEIAMVQEDGM